jgi:hypothetical protein
VESGIGIGCVEILKHLALVATAARDALTEAEKHPDADVAQAAREARKSLS